MKKFISVKLKDHIIAHGFDQNNNAIEEKVNVAEWSEKLIAVDRIKSVTEQHILMDYAHGRWIYWEYQGGLKTIKKLLSN
jgi:hypothetical protein